MKEYDEFLERKAQLKGMFGFEPMFMPDFLFDFQKALIDWAVRKGRAAIFADTGLGKTPMQLAFAQNVVQKTNKNVLILTPLAVSSQTISESVKFGIEAKRSRNGKPAGKITVTNYQQLQKFDPSDFVGLICDESSALKNFDGQTRVEVTRFSNKMPYRLLATATPSPNDFVELGTSSEVLGDLQYMDMVAQFFRDTSNDKNPQWSTPKYELKDHAVNDFWRWVVSWARAIRKPSDLGFSDALHVLPPLVEREHVIEASIPLPGEMFVVKARSLEEQRRERKSTVNERCDKARELCLGHDCSVVWAHYDYETDLLEKIIPNAIQISGKDSDEEKEEKFDAFLTGQAKRLVTKPKIGAFGLNWQHCAHMTMFPSHSYEQYYQGVRRCYRYGQKRSVTVDTITTEGEDRVQENVKRKARDAEKMFSVLVKHMNNELILNKSEQYSKEMELPKW